MGMNRWCLLLSEKKKHYYEMENKMLGALLLQIVLIFLMQFLPVRKLR